VYSRIWISCILHEITDKRLSLFNYIHNKGITAKSLLITQAVYLEAMYLSLRIDILNVKLIFFSTEVLMN